MFKLEWSVQCTDVCSKSWWVDEQRGSGTFGSSSYTLQRNYYLAIHLSPNGIKAVSPSTVTFVSVSPFIFYGVHCGVSSLCFFSLAGLNFPVCYNPLMHACLSLSAMQIIMNLAFVLQGKLMPTQKSGFFPSSCVKPYLDPKVTRPCSRVTVSSGAMIHAGMCWCRELVLPAVIQPK